MSSKVRKTTSKPSSSRRKHSAATTVIHAKSESGAEHAVGIGNLRVMLVDDEGSWFAQGLEIDYFAQGSTIEDVQRRFQSGLEETIDFHLKMFGTVEGVLRVAPKEVWDEFYGTQSGLRKLYTNLSLHFDDETLAALPFAAIDFYGTEHVA